MENCCPFQRGFQSSRTMVNHRWIADKIDLDDLDMKKGTSVGPILMHWGRMTNPWTWHDFMFLPLDPWNEAERRNLISAQRTLQLQLLSCSFATSRRFEWCIFFLLRTWISVLFHEQKDNNQDCHAPFTAARWLPGSDHYPEFFQL